MLAHAAAGTHQRYRPQVAVVAEERAMRERGKRVVAATGLSTA